MFKDTLLIDIIKRERKSFFLLIFNFFPYKSYWTIFVSIAKTMYSTNVYNILPKVNIFAF